MEVVARFLRTEAENRSEADGRDLFGRTAFNRYYFATFLNVRQHLGKLRSQWGDELPHATIPEVLRGQVKRTLESGAVRARRAADLSLASACKTAAKAAVALAEMMEKGRAVRVAADYHPEIDIDFSGGSDFKLVQVSVKTAETWPRLARIQMTQIENAWKQINV